VTNNLQTPPDQPRLSRRRAALRGLLLVLLAGLIAWGGAALWFDGPSTRWLAGLLATGFIITMSALLLWARPFHRAVFAVLAAFVIVLSWWLLIPPRNDRDWRPEVAQLPSATIEGNLVTIHNVRNFGYHSETDVTERWETRTYDLDRLRAFDMFLFYWGPTLYAHTIASWEFGDGNHVAVSIGARKEKGEFYSALRGFFRQYELYYVVADERDVIGARAKYRGERIYLYRLKSSHERARALLLDYLREINRLAESPDWYNAITHNCTTTIQHHADQIAAGQPWSWKLILNGYVDELGWERGMIDTSLPFAELRRRSEITEKAKAAFGDPAFSRRIREGLPDPRTPSRQ